MAEGGKDAALIDFRTFLYGTIKKLRFNFLFTSKIYSWERLKIFLGRSVFYSLIALNHNTRDHDFLPKKMPGL